MRKTNNYIAITIVLVLIVGCAQKSEIETYGDHYQKYKDYKSLSKVVELVKLESDTSYVKKILGEPIDMGFDYRYLVDSTGVKGCPFGAVFHITNGKIDDKWLDEICE